MALGAPTAAADKCTKHTVGAQREETCPNTLVLRPEQALQHNTSCPDFTPKRSPDAVPGLLPCTHFIALPSANAENQEPPKSFDYTPLSEK